MDSKPSAVLVLGIILTVLAAGEVGGWDNLRLNLTTAPTGWSDAQRRLKALSPYFGALGGVAVATVASSLSDEVGSFFLGTEALIFLLVAVHGYHNAPASNDSNAFYNSNKHLNQT